MLARITHYNKAFFALCKKLLPSGKKKFFVYPMLVVLVTIGVFGLTSPGQAFIEEAVNVLLVAFSWIMFILARLFIGITIFALKFFIEVASYNNFIDTPTVKIGWFLVRDVANMFFVVLLLVIAFGTILGIEQYEWKKTLVKLVLAAVFINFSNMIAQLIIDVAHVFTITFVNAISATAGGNIIRLFNIDAVYKITGADKLEVSGDIKIEAFAASVAAFLLSLIMMVTMGAFAIIMAARMVILWVLIILSPLAYIFQVIPQTQKYAQEWWSEFTNHVIVAPVMVFFLWLAFATLNTSVPQLDFGSAGDEATSVISSGATVVNAQKKLSLSEATTWENLSSFLIATVFLITGIRVVRSLGVVAGGLTSSATGFAKNVATIATGYAVGRKIADKGTGLAKKPFELVGKGAGFAVRRAPMIGTDKIKRGLKNQWEGAKAWAFNTGYTAKIREYTDENGKKRKEFVRDKNGRIVMEQHDRGLAQKFVHFFVAKEIAAEKRLEKTTNFANNRKELLDKRITGIPKYWLMKDYEQGIDALDRFEQGMLEGERERSGAKTEEFKQSGKESILHSKRYKDGELRNGAKDKTVAQQIAKHTIGADRVKAMMQAEKDQELRNVYEDPKNADLVAWMNAAEMLSKGAQDAIKEIKELDLQAKFKLAGDSIKDMLGDVSKMSATDIKKKIKDAFKAGSQLSKEGITSAYVASLAQAQMAQVATESKTTRERQASDAAHDTFIHMPRYGTTSASSVLADLAEVKLKQNYAGLDRAAGMQQATDILMKLQAEQKRLDADKERLEKEAETLEASGDLKGAEKKREEAAGKEMDIDKQVEMYAASAFLQSEAWNDDQASYIYDKFEGVQAKMKDGKELDANDQAVLSFAEDAQKLGWIQGDVMTGGKFDQKKFEALDLSVSKKYGREKAADMQNLAITSGDVNLSLAHKAIAAEVDANQIKLDSEIDIAVEDEKNRFITEDKNVIAIRAEAEKKAIENAHKRAKKKALKKGSSEEEATAIANEYVKTDKVKEAATAAADAAMMGLEEVQIALLEVAKAKKQKAKDDGRSTDYWEVADAVLPKAGIKGIASADQLRQRYDKYGDFMQHATINFKKWGLANGHEQLGYNQDFDETKGVYRFQTESEAQGKMYAERVKYPVRKLINTDQKHSMGDLDLETGIIDRFREQVLATTFGRVTKAIDLTDIPLRQLKAKFYLHHSEEANKREIDDVQHAVIGGASSRKKFAKDGHTTNDQRLQHVLTQNLLVDLMNSNSGKGMAMALHKLFGHITEKDAQKGVINIVVEGKSFHKISDLADYIGKQIEINPNYLEGSQYQGQHTRVKSKLRQIKQESASSEVQDEDAEEDTSAEELAVLDGTDGGSTS